MGQYIDKFSIFNSSKFKIIKHIEWKKICYIHLSIFKEVLELIIKEWYEILGWEAIIDLDWWTLSPVELVIWTWPEIDRISRNKNALYRDYKYFVGIINKRIWSWEYSKENIFVDLIIKR